MLNCLHCGLRSIKTSHWEYTMEHVRSSFWCSRCKKWDVRLWYFRQFQTFEQNTEHFFNYLMRQGEVEENFVVMEQNSKKGGAVV